jgi:transposase
VITPLFPELVVREDGHGRPPTDTRAMINGVLSILRTGVPSRDLPERLAPYQTCHRRFQEWCKTGALREVLEALAENLRSFGELDLSECFIDADFVAAKKRGSCVGKTKRGNGTKLMAAADRSGLPIAVYAASASPHEVTLVKDTLAQRHVVAAPSRLIGDRAYDSDPLDTELAAEGIEPIAPHRSNRKKAPTQDGASCAATFGAGRLSGCLPGCKTSAQSSRAGNIMSPITSASRTLAASASCLETIFETHFSSWSHFRDCPGNRQAVRRCWRANVPGRAQYRKIAGHCRRSAGARSSQGVRA